jgi:tripartite-type tricarboxylate transporter receptor subunit TctC
MRLIIKLCLVLIFCLTGISSAQTYPNKTVTIVVPFAPGGVTDVVARLYARKLSTLTGSNFNVENKAGAGGTIGTDFVARAPKDGYDGQIKL